MKESALYAPVKNYFQSQGFEVKGEVGAADVMAVRGSEPPVIVELKLGFSLVLYHQALERLRVADDVYIAVLRPEGRAGFNRLKANISMCRRLGIGLLTLRARDHFLEVHCVPGPYAPRKSKKKATQMVRAFERLEGDPNQRNRRKAGAHFPTNKSERSAT